MGRERGLPNERYIRSLNFAFGLFDVFQSWGLKSDITEYINPLGNSIYRIWVRGKLGLQVLSEIIYKKANNEDFHIYKRVYMTQHTNHPFVTEDRRPFPMWKVVADKIVHTPISSRISFRTNISKSILNELNALAMASQTYVNHLIESGLRNIFSQKEITFNKISKSKDRIQYKTTYDKQLLIDIRELANNHNLFINDVIENSVQFIDLKKVKKRSQQ